MLFELGFDVLFLLCKFQFAPHQSSKQHSEHRPVNWSHYKFTKIWIEATQAQQNVSLRGSSRCVWTQSQTRVRSQTMTLMKFYCFHILQHSPGILAFKADMFFSFLSYNFIIMNVVVEHTVWQCNSLQPSGKNFPKILNLEPMAPQRGQPVHRNFPKRIKKGSIIIIIISELSKKAGLVVADPVCPKVSSEVGVRALCRPVNFHHTKLGKLFLYSAHIVQP